MHIVPDDQFMPKVSHASFLCLCSGIWRMFPIEEVLTGLGDKGMVKDTVYLSYLYTIAKVVSQNMY